MKRTLFFLLLVLTMMSCANVKSFNKTVWSGPTTFEKDGQKGNIITSLYFTSDSNVIVYKAVFIDTSLVVKPFKYAQGEYIIVSETQKDLKIKITGNDIQERPITYKGFCYDGNAMILVSQDSEPMVFGKTDIKLP